MPAELLISRVSVTSFRCLRRVDIEIDPTTTVLVGENNAGKSSVLLALDTALGRRRASTDDLYRSNNSAVAESATIDVFLSPPTGRTAFTDDIAQRLLSVHRLPGSSTDVVAIRTVLQRSAEGSLLVEKRMFLQPDGDNWIESRTPFQPRVLELVDTHLLDASRDLLNEMAAQTSPWGRVLSDLRIPVLPDLEQGGRDPHGLQAIEEELEGLANRVRAASPVLSQLQSDLGRMADTQAGIARVDLAPLPHRVEDLGRAMEIVLHQNHSVGLPLRFHGSGSRSLAALLVFKTMCTLRSGADRGVRPHLLTLLEEPEAHLHPQAVAALVRTIASLPGQHIVSTHSASLVAEVSPLCLRILRRCSDGIRVSEIKTMRMDRAEQFRRFFGRPFGEIVFARLAILGDGVGEQNTLPALIRMALSADPSALGIAFVDCKSMSDHTHVNRVLRVLHDLGIPWIYFADNDESGLADLSRARDPATNLPLTEEHPSVATLHGTRQIEQLLIDAGYGDEITALALEYETIASDDSARLRFLCDHKAWASEQVALRACASGKAPPPQLGQLTSVIRTALGITAPEAPPSGMA